MARDRRQRLAQADLRVSAGGERSLCRARGLGRCCATLGLAVLSLWLGAAPHALRAHELDYQSLQLIWDPASACLRGQVITEPQRVAGEGAARATRLLAQIRANLRVEVDGNGCPLRLEVRELWVPAGATPGDVVMAYCSPGHVPARVRVFAGAWLHGLQVTLQRVAADGGVLSDRALVLGGSWSPVFDFWASRPGSGEPATQPRVRAADSGERAASRWELAGRYLGHGIGHILDGGWDHVAFVAALVVGVAGGAGAGSAGFTALLVRLTTFTVAHSITLALGALGWVVLPRPLIELSIAVSIAAMALLGVRTRRTRASGRAALALAFGFGLLHGQGFASVLIDAGLPVAGLVVALLAFNVGVELGQALWAGVFWLGLRALPEAHARARLVLCAWLLFGLGLYWTWERLLVVLA